MKDIISIILSAFHDAALILWPLIMAFSVSHKTAHGGCHLLSGLVRRSVCGLPRILAIEVVSKYTTHS
jgi:hypothetical protein